LGVANGGPHFYLQAREIQFGAALAQSRILPEDFKQQPKHAEADDNKD
jgi:hypothetical protein